MATTTRVPKKHRQIRLERGRRQRPRPPAAITPAYVQELLSRGRITERDQALMLALADCSVLSHAQVKRLYWPGTTEQACRRRLCALYDAHLLDRAVDVSPGMEEIGLEPGIVYALGRAGRVYLEKLNGREKLPDYPLASATRLLHDLGLAEVMVCLTEALRERGVALLWQGEAGARVVAEGEGGKMGRVLLEPDALMTLRYERQGAEVAASFFVEWDAGSERGLHFRRKVRGYDSVRRRERLWQDKGLPRFPAVALVTVSERRADGLLEQVRDTRQTEVLWLLTDVAALRGAPLGPIWRVLLKDGRVLDGQSLLPGVA